MPSLSNIDSDVSPKTKGCNKKIARLLDADFIKEVYHPDWLANRVLVPKKNKEWRMCVNCTNLNKACKKIPLCYLRWIKSWTPRPGTTFYVFLIVTRGITRSPSRKKIRSRHLSSLCLALFVIQLCHSNLKVWVQLIKGVYSGVYTHSSGITWKHMWMMWLSKLENKKDSSLTWQRPLTT
jgi:hypothetical protein